MSKKSEQLLGHTRDLIETTERLRQVLLDYRKACERLVRAGERGRRSSSTVERLELLKFAETRELVTGAIKEFESARHKTRVDLVAVAEEEGSNLTEVARTLGVSRQLTSRLSIEGRNGDD
jgi:hypothetical protein